MEIQNLDIAAKIVRNFNNPKLSDINLREQRVFHGTDHVKFFKGDKGEILGFTIGGKIYLDPRYAKPETPLHEYTHLWADMIRKVDPDAWNDIATLMKGEKELWDYVSG